MKVQLRKSCSPVLPLRALCRRNFSNAGHKARKIFVVPQILSTAFLFLIHNILLSLIVGMSACKKLPETCPSSLREA